MKIAFILDKFPVLSETFILNQITGLIDRGHDVEIMAASNGNEAKVHPDVQKYGLLDKTYYFGVLHHNMPFGKAARVLDAVKLAASNPGKIAMLKSMNLLRFGRAGVSLRNLYKILPFLGRGRYDVIHCHFGPAGNLGALLKHTGALTGKLVTTFHGYDMTSHIRARGEKVYDFLFKTGDLFMPISFAWKKRLVGMGCEERKIYVHRMGINTKEYKFIPWRANRNGKVNLLSVARLVEKKGIKYGIMAAAKVMLTHHAVQYTVAGEGPLKEEMVELSRKLGLRRSMRFLGWCDQEEIRSAMAEADVLLAPSVTASDGDSEGIPVVLMEAMARGMPVVSTSHSGIPELVEDGVSGFTVPERDIDALADRLACLIENPRLASEMGLAGRRRIENEYDIDKLNDRLEGVYRSVCGQGPE